MRDAADAGRARRRRRARTCRSRSRSPSPARRPRWSSRSSCSRSPGASRGSAATRAAARCPRWVTAVVDSAALRWALRALGLVLVGLHGDDRDLRAGRLQQPDGRPGVRRVLARAGARRRSCSARSGATLNPIRTLHLLVAAHDRSGAGGGRAATAARRHRLLAGRGRAAGVRLARAGRAGPGDDAGDPDVLGRLLRRPARRRGDLRLALARPRRRVRGVLRAASGGCRRSVGGPTVASWSATRWRTSTGSAPAPGLAATVCVLLGSTAYDSLSGAPRLGPVVRSPGRSAPTLGGTLGLVGSVRDRLRRVRARDRARPAGWPGSPRRGCRAQFAHAIVPIVLGYFVAHYFTLFVIEGQRTMIAVSDPFSDGSNWFGTAGRVVDQSIASAPDADRVDPGAARSSSGHVARRDLGARPRRRVFAARRGAGQPAAAARC